MSSAITVIQMMKDLHQEDDYREGYCSHCWNVYSEPVPYPCPTLKIVQDNL